MNKVTKRIVLIAIFTFILIVLFSTKVHATNIKLNLSGEYNYDLAMQVLEKTNQKRVENGLEKLEFNRELSDVAMLRAAESCIYFSHTRPNQTSYSTLSSLANGENLASGQRSAQAVVDSWMNSTGHRENILNSNYKSMAVGVFVRGGAYYWCQNFSYSKSNNTSHVSGVKQVAEKIDTNESLIKSFDCNLDHLDSYAFKYNSTNDIIISATELGWTNDVKVPLDANQATYTVENEKVCKVVDGKLKILGFGTTKLTIKVGSAVKSYTITGGLPDEEDPNATLSLNKGSYQLNNLNETFQLKTILSNGKNAKVTWSSSNSKIVTVNSNGLITAKKGGFAYVYAKSETYGTKSCWVYVAVPIELSTGEKRYAGDMNGDGRFNSVDSAMILDAFKDASNGDQLLIGDLNGDELVNAVDSALMSEIYVNNTFNPGNYYHINEIKLSKTKINLKVKGTEKLTATITPSNTTDSKKIKWSTSNSKIVTVDSNGKITAVAGGKATITAQTSNGKKATCTVEVDNIPFVDVKTSDWFYNDVKYVYENKLITGYSDKIHFGPNDKITRAMVVTILYRMEGNPTVTGNSKFKDVKQNVWYSKAIKWATDKGIIHGYNSEKFGPNDNITRQDLMVILRNYAKYKKKDTNVTMDLSKYTDKNKIAPYAKSAVEWAVKNGILVGSNGKLNPQGTATRAEMAAFIHRYCTKIGR